MYSDDIIACAKLVERGDPLRFRAVMASPAALRPALFTLFAFNVEVARAPWITKEAMIAEMRLQWWHDALGEIANGDLVRRHEVVTSLAYFITLEAPPPPNSPCRFHDVGKRRRGRAVNSL